MRFFKLLLLVIVVVLGTYVSHSSIYLNNSTFGSSTPWEDSADIQDDLETYRDGLSGDEKTFIKTYFDNPISLSTGTDAQKRSFSETLHNLQKTMDDDEHTYGETKNYWYDEWVEHGGQWRWDNYDTAKDNQQWLNDVDYDGCMNFSATNQADLTVDNNDIWTDGDHWPWAKQIDYNGSTWYDIDTTKGVGGRIEATLPDTPNDHDVWLDQMLDVWKSQ